MPNAIKSGRAWNGSHRDMGTIVHFIPGIKPNGDWFTPALCGNKPGFRGNGWHETNSPVTCTKCLKKLSLSLIKYNIER